VAIGISELIGPIGKGWVTFPAFAAVSAAASSALLWPRLYRKRPPTFLRGALAGTQITLLAYPLTWGLMFFGYWIWSLGAPQHDSAIPAWTAIPATFLYSLWGIVLTGRFSVPIGAITGGLLALWNRKGQASV
jgi:hypothetical protein